MKPFILLCMLCAMGSAGVRADQVTLQVTGTIRGAGCEVDSASKNLQIALGDAPAGSFQQAGKTGDWINFSLSVINCPATTTTVTATFTGASAPTDTRYYANTGTGAGLALELSTGDHSTTLRPGATLIKPVNPDDHSAPFPLAARYVATGEKLVAGTFQSAIQVTFTYQ
ncbi:fimbrial protein [Cronobacter dublinensis]|uniref:Type 1 fimbrae adaptor subunit FimG n=1 Tax=Cronobacter dublinensis 1210 TaxID=1208656 RepID=A0ABP1WCS6_9ENTR|nr:fimbrial protein [Cronobacter dublinensis]ALB66174.1 type 1 fimbriae adaptor subunit FimG [Cronobacter dublinensis subsp. dublinensis LMG 23823]MDI7271869.1 fimbrial protein [Cronobacter dublinensis]MDI7505517.1 fimbrial protein [Cronobacter dublinensis]CCJ83368.1 type 1 fimbrae adaptor subunit FimG [Cronobacter dublinensis 1210]